MTFKTPKCQTKGCRQRAVAIIETVTVQACIEFDEDDKTFDYAGESKVDWDSQRATETSGGLVTVCCANGHEWRTRVDWGDEPAPAAVAS